MMGPESRLGSRAAFADVLKYAERRFEMKPPGGFDFYEVGAEDEREAASDATAEVAETAAARADELAHAQDLHVAEVLWLVAQRLEERSRGLLLDEPAWPEPE
jgi:hypothetical protein